MKPVLIQNLSILVFYLLLCFPQNIQAQLSQKTQNKYLKAKLESLKNKSVIISNDTIFNAGIAHGILRKEKLEVCLLVILFLPLKERRFCILKQVCLKESANLDLCWETIEQGNCASDGTCVETSAKGLSIDKDLFTIRPTLVNDYVNINFSENTLHQEKQIVVMNSVGQVFQNTRIQNDSAY